MGTVSRAGWRVLVASVVAGALDTGVGHNHRLWRVVERDQLVVHDGIGLRYRRRGHAGRAFGTGGGTTVVVDRYLCPKNRDGCLGEHHEGVVDRRALTVDPLLRTAAIQTDVGGCVVDVHFWGVSEATPDGSFGEQYGGGGALMLGANQTVSRQAEWTGQVCGQDLGGKPGEAWLSRSGSVNVGRFGRAPEGGE